MSRSRINRYEKIEEEARECFARHVCYESVSPRSISDENVFFRNYFRALNPNFRIPLSSLEINCMKVYAEEREKVREVLSRLGHISLSVDVLLYEENWESYEEYICVCVHFINEDWKLQKWVIKYSNQEFFSSETILKSLKEWDIEGKVFTITVGGSKDMVEVVKEEIQERRELALNGQLFHVQCSGDIISRMVEEGYKMIKEIINKVRELSWSKSEPIWYLTSFKLRDALKLEALGEFSSEWVRQDYDVPTEEEWEKVRNICRIADKIYDIVEGLFEVKKPTANLFLPHLQQIRAYLTQELGSSGEFVKSVAQKMLTTFDEYWKNMYLVLAIAAFMDPRYKMKFIEFTSSALEGGDGDSKATFVLENICKLYDGYVIPNDQKEYLLSSSSSESEEEDGIEDEEEDEDWTARHSEKQCIKLLERLDILKKYSLLVPPTNDQPHKSDLDLYLEEPVFPWTENFSVLQWWKDNRSRFPHLSKMARDFLAIPMSVATSYDAYYTAPRQADFTLLSLKPELMNALKCTRSWRFGNKIHEEEAAAVANS